MEHTGKVFWYQNILYQWCQNSISERHFTKNNYLLTNEKHVLLGSYFCTHVFYLLDFDVI